MGADVLLEIYNLLHGQRIKIPFPVSCQKLSLASSYRGIAYLQGEVPSVSNPPSVLLKS